MLSVTPNAVRAIQGLVGDRPDGGLRISPAPSGGSETRLGLEISDRPHAGDEVFEEGGCRVFVDGEVAPALEGRTLDVERDGDSSIQFSLHS